MVSFYLSLSQSSSASTTKSHTFWSPSLRQCRNLQTALSPIVSSSYLPTSYITQKQIEIPTSPVYILNPCLLQPWVSNFVFPLRQKHDFGFGLQEKQSPPVQEGLGAFQKLPMVMPSIDLYASALRKSKRVQPTKGIANIAKRERNRGAKQLDAFMKELALPLKGYMESFPRKKLLHPYERSLIDLTLGDGKYEEVLGKVDVLRKKVQSVGKEHASLCAKALSKKEAEERLSEGVEKLELVFQQQGGAVDDLLTIAKVLRAMPVVDLEMPTLCLVGAPNVGKSSLVRILSTGKPEICNYPFTTRGILMGHIVLNYQRFQVTDTPGLLRRCDEDRNNLEKLTLAVLTHLPTAVLYVHDLTGECGTSPSDQFQIYKEMKERFKDYLWIDAVSKCDLLGGSPVMYAKEDRSSDDAEIIKYRERGPDESIHVSVKTEQGLNELKNKVKEVLSSEMEKIQSGEKTDQSVATC
ncbi:P-loop containing nucleoside triphosphate hydrolases superfamily protein [Arabidopsis thaliana]|uniref:P-loop containing nucleoside triphosphate hydrolases superfamily protein n=1 Tax=Arabidopsis thaliana TaxID=3702 RepID=A0A1P8APB2_ARATH|nr:P-loop containing nucleoside triphosphate hydrolases superfamily protein [Arabidopsis thaliana]ANM58435.1 P-loop containing nucleoside triphosphate hydrolases superfamily protein [Arabidopsis thaliana]|eukprot:NP_001320869.1 P-loop containing nucleoside triphosphate hydrolases superfamily protein [Arabidopsis thaliana]